MSARVQLGDCLDVMATLDAASVDAIVTDPPYGLGFMGKAWDHGVPGVPFWTEALRVAKPGVHLIAFGGTRTFHRLACAIEDAGWELRDCLSWLYGSGFPKSHNGPWGGTALKPAWEPIILARKPLAGTVAETHAQHGTAGLNIEGCRIEGEKAGGSGGAPLQFGGVNARPFHEGAVPREFDTSKGRWPANVVLDEEAAAVLDAQAPDVGAVAPASGPSLREAREATVAYGARVGLEGDPAFHDDGGAASRFFYCAKAARSEREEGLERMPERAAAGSLNLRTDAHSAATGQLTSARVNHHPTVKPIALMRWLCRLVTPPEGLVLDPFTGSGSTGCAAVREGFRFLGIEEEAEYVEIATRRLAWHVQQRRDETAQGLLL